MMTHEERREERRARRAKYRCKGKAANTLRAYANAWGKFGAWCEAEGTDRATATPEDVADFLCEMADLGRARRTMQNYRFGISYHFREIGRNPNPAKDDVVLSCMEGIRRETGETVGQPDALRADDVARIMAFRPKVRGPSEARQIRRGKLAIRLMHEALLRVGECAALEWPDVIWPEPDSDWEEVHDDQPAKIIIRKSKGDQLGVGVTRSVSARTRSDLEVWRDITWGPPDPTGTYIGDPTGPVIGVTAHRIWSDVRKLVRGVGLEGRVSTHSCRIGATIDAYLSGMDIETCRVLGRWKSASQVRHYLKPYLKELDPMAAKFADDPLAATFANTAS